MKKLLSLLLALSLVLSLAGCAFVSDLSGEDIDAIVDGLEQLESVFNETEEQTDATDPSITDPTQANTEAPTEDATEALTETPTEAQQDTLDPVGTYTSKEDVALYIHLYGRLPGNFITKSQARQLGWKSGSLEKYAPGKCIGGDRFGNYEGLLPKAPGRTYTECDIDTLGAGSRGAKRIVFSNDGLVYYTDDHYESFTLLYGEE